MHLNHCRQKKRYIEINASQQFHGVEKRWFNSVHIGHTWLIEPHWLPRHLDAPPPQSQGAIVAEQDVAVDLLIKPFVVELRGVAPLMFTWWTVVLVPVLGSHSHWEVNSGQKAQHWANDQSCGITVVYHGQSGVTLFYCLCPQTESTLKIKLYVCIWL